MSCLNCKERRRNHHSTGKCLYGPAYYLTCGRWISQQSDYHSGIVQRSWVCGQCGVNNNFIQRDGAILDEERTICNSCGSMNIITLQRKAGNRG